MTQSSSGAGQQPSVPATQPATPTGTGADDTGADSSTQPYADALNLAFKKLTSEVFIFLLAYVILLIGMGVFAQQAEKSTRYLLYAIPVVGIAGELLLRKGPIVRKAGEEAARQVRVKAGRTTRGSKVIGASAPSGKDLPESIEVAAKRTDGGSTVQGVDIRGPAPTTPRDHDASPGSGSPETRADG